MKKKDDNEQDLTWETWMSNKEPGSDLPILTVSEPVVLDYGIHPTELYYRLQEMMLDRGQMPNTVNGRLSHKLGNPKKGISTVRFALLRPWLEIKTMSYGKDQLAKRLLAARLMPDLYPKYGLRPATALEMFMLFLRLDPVALLKGGSIAAPGTVITDIETNDELIPVAITIGNSVTIGLQSNCPFVLPENFTFFGVTPDRYLGVVIEK
jgi:hypothetical protein